MAMIDSNQVPPAVTGFRLPPPLPQPQTEFFDADEFFDPVAAEKATDGKVRVFSSATVWVSRPLTMTPKVALSTVYVSYSRSSLPPFLVTQDSLVSPALRDVRLALTRFIFQGPRFRLLLKQTSYRDRC